MTDTPRDEVLFHPDFRRLERELGDRIEPLLPATTGRVPRILVLAPTKRQVDRVREALSARFPALLGVEVITHMTLVRRVTGSSAEDSPQVADRPLREALVERLLQATPDSPACRRDG